MPSNGNKICWYSYNLGFIHFIVMLSEHDSSVGSTQCLWLQYDLQSADRILTQFILLYTHKVDLYVAGHWYSVSVCLLYSYYHLRYFKKALRRIFLSLVQN